jgi:hypothetical protein
LNLDDEQLEFSVYDDYPSQVLSSLISRCICIITSFQASSGSLQLAMGVPLAGRAVYLTKGVSSHPQERMMTGTTATSPRATRAMVYRNQVKNERVVSIKSAAILMAF